MHYFPLLDFQYIVLTFFLGIVFLMALYLAFLREEKNGGRERQEEYPDGIRAGNGPFPLVLIFLYLAVMVWAIVYVMKIGIKGNPF
jgi:hypothetical protein